MSLSNISLNLLTALWGGDRIDEAEVRKIVSADHQNGGPMSEGLPRGPEGLIAFATRMRTGFPDEEYQVLDQEESGNAVRTYVRYHGTQTGQLGPFPATGRQAVVDVTVTDTFKDGKIVSTLAEWDPSAMFEQLGIDPTQPV
jgi:predicted ester cyclase